MTHCPATRPQPSNKLLLCINFEMPLHNNSIVNTNSIQWSYLSWIKLWAVNAICYHFQHSGWRAQGSEIQALRTDMYEYVISKVVRLFLFVFNNHDFITLHDFSLFEFLGRCLRSLMGFTLGSSYKQGCQLPMGKSRDIIEVDPKVSRVSAKKNFQSIFRWFGEDRPPQK